MSRYSRHIILDGVGPEGQAKLSAAKVLVIGAGGLGCPVLQYLAAAGVGTLGVIDYDAVELSNLQRQVLFGTSQLGLNKALAAKTRLEDLNPEIQIQAYPERLTSKNALALFEKYDLIVDGSDNFSTRYLVNDASILTKKPVVFGAIYKFEGQVSVFNFNEGPSYRCLFPHPPKDGSVANCSEVGVLGVLPGIIGTMQANEAIKIILNLEHILSGKLLCYNAKTTEITRIKVVKMEGEINKIKSLKGKFEEHYPINTNATLVPEVTAEQAFQMDHIQFIDVRELDEFPKIDLPPSLQIPLRTLDQNLNRLRAEQTYIVFCQSGVRSKLAVQTLNENNIPNCFSMFGGAQAIIEHLKLQS